jgi:tRNA (guanine37-N1)-methyltransferase
MRIDVVTIFPDYLDPLRQSLPGKAIDAGIVQLAVHDLRRWTHAFTSRWTTRRMAAAPAW